MTVQQANSKTTTYILLALLVIGAAVAAGALLVASRPAETAEPEGYTGTVYDPPVQLSAFTMPSSQGGPLSLSDLSDRWTLIFFGYTHCPDFCPLTLAEFKRIKGLLEDDAGAVQFVFVSVDGARDTPEALARYLSRFDPEFIGLSGDDETLARIQPDFGLFYERHAPAESGANYLVDHSTRSYLIDRQGYLRVSYAYGTEPEVVAESIRRQLRGDQR